MSAKRKHFHDDRAELATEQAHYRADKEESEQRSCLALAHKQGHKQRGGKTDEQNEIQIPHFFAPFTAQSERPSTDTDIATDKTPLTVLFCEAEHITYAAVTI